MFGRQNSRGSAGAVAVFSSSLFAAIVCAVWPAMMVTLRQYIFVPFIVTTTGMLVFMFLYLPETKNTPVNMTAALFEEGTEFRSMTGLKSTSSSKTEEEKLGEGENRL